jgi:hypothetical protein
MRQELDVHVQVGPQPDQGLLAPAGALLRPEQPGVLALTGGGAGLGPRPPAGHGGKPGYERSEEAAR